MPIPWTTFWDMHSGGYLKEEPYSKIYIEAPEDEARVIFYNRFGHSPDRVSCTCCGEDYSVDEYATLEQVSGYHRNCRNLETPRDPETNCYKNDDPVLKANYYVEDGQDPPAGYRIDTSRSRYGTYVSLADYIKQPDVLVIRDADIKPEERQGEVPTQGYVWQD